MLYPHEEFTSDGYKNLYISLFFCLVDHSLPIGKHARDAKKGNKTCDVTHKETARKKPKQPHEPGCGGFTGRDDALLSPPAAARPISMSPPASSS